MTPYYEHAGITIYHGDCREVLPTLPKVDLVVTDHCEIAAKRLAQETLPLGIGGSGPATQLPLDGI